MVGAACIVTIFRNEFTTLPTWGAVIEDQKKTPALRRKTSSKKKVKKTK
jgi:hypothetical protein